MLFKLLRIRKSIKEAKANPGGFAGEQAAEVVTGLLIIPGIIALVGLVLFFLLGYTHLLGGPMGFFRFLFVLGLIVSVIALAIVVPIIRLIKGTTRRAVDAGVDGTKRTIKEVTNEKV